MKPERRMEDRIYEDLSRLPVPLPEGTPFDDDAGKRGAYLRGYADAWHYVITSELLYATVGPSSTLYDEDREAWLAGWQAGCPLAAELWTREATHLRGMTNSAR